MKKYRGPLIVICCLLLCVGAAWIMMQVTEEYPALGVSVSYPADQIAGVDLTMEKPTWSPFKGYTIRWVVAADTKDVYCFTNGDEYLERCIDGQWYRLTRSQNELSFNPVEFSVGGDTTRLQGSIVQKYDHYGTRLETGAYRIVLEMKAQDGASYYLTEEFSIE